MPEMQSYFETFHSSIRSGYKINSTLQSKKDIILEKIEKYLKANQLPGFKPLLQGSYATRTGIKPINGNDYDIDVGLRFQFNKDEYEPAVVRQWVLDAVKDHTHNVEDKGPCIRVIYADKSGYHVDLVTYSWWDDQWGQEHFRMAHKEKGWIPANPPGLLRYISSIRDTFSNTQDNATKTDQFRRVVRYIRRWNDVQYGNSVSTKPSGLAMLLLAAQYLHPGFDADAKLDDCKALGAFASIIKDIPGRIIAQKPTPEFEDMFGGLNLLEMETLKLRFSELEEALYFARYETTDPRKACERLSTIFGPDFPLPSASSTAEKTISPAIVTSSSSA